MKWSNEMNLMTVSFETLAGMPIVLPFESETYQRLSGSFSYRLQALSFFIVGLFLCAGLATIPLQIRMKKGFAS